MQVPGDRFGEFLLRREIGNGAMGTVWEAHQPSLDRIVALKILSAGTSSDPVWVARFKAEAAQAARLHHPGILPVYAIGETEGVHWFAMELVDGEDLSRRLARDGALPAREAARIAKEAAEALHHAHENGVVHRDVKPANLMVRSDGRVVVADFGLSKHVSSGGLTTTGLLVGTPYYMSPELFAGRSDGVGPATDVYGLGVTTYEMILGRVPFQAENAVALLKKIAEQDPTPPSKIDPTIPRDLETIVLTCLAKRPEGRYASAQELAEDLGRFIDDRPIARRRPGWLERAQRFTSRNRLVVGIAAASILTIVGLFFVFNTKLDSQEDEYRRKIAELSAEADRLSDEGSSEGAEAQFQKISELARSRPGGQDDARWAQGRALLTRLVAGKPLTKENIAILADWKSGASARVVMRADALDARVNLQTIPGPMAAEEVSLPIEGRDLSPGFYRFHVSAPGRVPTIATAFLPPGARATIEIVLPKADATTAGMLSYGGSWLPRLNSHADATQKDNPVVRREQTAYLLDAKRVTVREYAAFLLERPANERRSLVPKNWPVGGAPRARMDDAVVGLTLDQADAYAKSKGKRVPVTGELVNAAMPGLIAPMLDSPANGAADLSDPEARRALLKSVGALIERLDGLAQWDGEPEWAHTTQGTGKPWPILGGEGRPKPPIAAAAGTHIHLRLAR